MLKNKIIEGIIKKIETKIYKNEKINISDIEKISGYSRRYIQLIFKEKTGMKISTYIRKRKLSLSAILIRLTRRSIFHIAMDLNFSSLQSFTRSFAREFKISPSKYRSDKHFDCSCLIPPFAFEPQKYLLKKGLLHSKKLSVKEFTLTESLIGSRLNRAKKIRKENIFKIAALSKDAFIITYIHPLNIIGYDITLKTIIGFENEKYNYEIKAKECWILEFIGEWEDYVTFGRFLTFKLDIKLGNTIIEKISLIPVDKCNDTQKYRAEIYLPIQ
ncbi:TPA: helix-turn-helix domain-containing protein [Escherichia coli]|nr:helix-turn-helix domain-containing protein [Escherichia coli]